MFDKRAVMSSYVPDYVSASCAFFFQFVFWMNQGERGYMHHSTEPYQRDNLPCLDRVYRSHINDRNAPASSNNSQETEMKAQQSMAYSKTHKKRKQTIKTEPQDEKRDKYTLIRPAGNLKLVCLVCSGIVALFNKKH